MSSDDRIVTSPLQAEQRLSQAEFHEHYETVPKGTKYELIGGVVVMPSPVGHRHNRVNIAAHAWLAVYSFPTPEVEGGAEGSTILDEFAEVQPDGFLRIETERRGNTEIYGDRVVGAPDLVVEIAAASRAIDLGPKLLDYERGGTLEYVGFALDPDEVFWHVRQGDKLVRVEPDADGLFRSRAFPGLWLDPIAFLANNGPAIMEVLEPGLASEAHVAFAQQLANRV